MKLKNINQKSFNTTPRTTTSSVYVQYTKGDWHYLYLRKKKEKRKRKFSWYPVIEWNDQKKSKAI